MKRYEFEFTLIFFGSILSIICNVVLMFVTFQNGRWPYHLALMLASISTLRFMYILIFKENED